MKRGGFTMIELVFVIVILGILAAVAVPQLTQSRADAKAAEQASNDQTCAKETELYAFDPTQYPGHDSAATLPGCVAAAAD